MRGHVVLATAFAIACGGALAQAYRWVDDQGHVHYTQTPPPAGAKDVRIKSLRQSPTSAAVDLPFATQQAAKNFPVKLYTQPDCGPCDQVRAALVKRTVPFSEVSVVSQSEVEEVRKISGKSGVPLLVVGSLFQSGFEEGLINSLLDTAGYPPAGPRVPLEALRKSSPPQSPASRPPSTGSAAGGADSASK